MKTFSELISWELEEEKKLNRPARISTEESSSQLGGSVLRKVRYLSAAAAGQERDEESASAVAA